MSEHMTTGEVLNCVDEIGFVSSRTEKEELLAKLLKDDLGAFCFRWAYDPFKVFGIKPDRPDGTNCAPVAPFYISAAEKLLVDLSERKVTGDKAIEAVSLAFHQTDAAGAELLFRILRKDMMCGIGAPTLNKLMPGLIPVFQVMRAKAFEEKRVKSWPVAVEPKYDGFRYTFICRKGSAGFFTRSGDRAVAVDHMVPAMLEIAKNYIECYQKSDLAYLLRDEEDYLSFVLDGEMMGGGETFNETSSALRRKSEQALDAHFILFDLLSLKEFEAVGTVNVSYKERRKRVAGFAGAADMSKATKGKIKKSEVYLANSFTEIMDFYDRFRARKLEGAMVKALDGGYDKKQSWNWLKIKPIETEDLMICGFYPGEKYTKYENCLGGLVVRRNGVEVDIGGGFSDQQRQIYWDLLQKDIVRFDKSGVKVEEKTGKTVVASHLHFDDTHLIGNLAEIEFNEVTPDGSLRHPRFIRTRDDKRGEMAA